MKTLRSRTKRRATIEGALKITGQIGILNAIDKEGNMIDDSFVLKDSKKAVKFQIMQLIVLNTSREGSISLEKKRKNAAISSTYIRNNRNKNHIQVDLPSSILDSQALNIKMTKRGLGNKKLVESKYAAGKLSPEEAEKRVFRIAKSKKQ